MPTFLNKTKTKFPQNILQNKHKNTKQTNKQKQQYIQYPYLQTPLHIPLGGKIHRDVERPGLVDGRVGGRRVLVAVARLADVVAVTRRVKASQLGVVDGLWWADG